MCKVKGISIPSCYGGGVKRRPSAKAGNGTPKGFIEDEVEDEDQEVISAVRRSTEERRRRKAMYMPYDFSWKFPPATEKLFVATSELEDGLSEIISVTPKMEECIEEKERWSEDDDFHSAASSLSDPPPSSNETIAAVLKSFAECHWLESVGKQVPETWKKHQGLLDCQGWPFGLLRKALLFPPLPCSPSDSWTWAKKQTKGPENRKTPPCVTPKQTRPKFI